MQFITGYALGRDTATLLLAVAVLALGALLAAVIVVRRAAARQAEPAALGSSLLSSGISLGLWAGVPVLGLSLLVVDSFPDRVLRAAMILLGLALGGFSAWLGQRLLAAFATGEEGDAPADAVRAGGLLAAASVGIAALPVAVAVWFLRERAGEMILALAAGTALMVLGIRVVGAMAESAAASAALLAGSHELELGREDPANLSAAALRETELLRHGAGRGAQLTAVAALLAGAGTTVGVTVLATEGIVVTVLALGVAVAAPLLALVIPHRGAPGREGAAYRLGALVPALLGAAAAVSATALWLPSQYQNLRFDAVGLGTITDPAIVASATPRADLVAQLETALGDLGPYLDATDESREASALLDLISVYATHPGTLAALALALGALGALCVQTLIAAHAAPGGAAARRIARTARTGASLGILTGLGGAAALAGAALAATALLLTVLGVLAAGVPLLALTMIGLAGLGALIVVSGNAASHAAVTVDRPGVEEDWRSLVRGRSEESAAGLAVAGGLGLTALLAPVVAAIQAAGRAGAVWEDRFLHAMTPTSLSVVAGIALGAATALAVLGFVADGQRRLAATAVLEARSAHVEERPAVSFAGMGLDARRAGLVVLSTAALAPIAAGFALGPAAVPAYLASLVMVGLAVSLWALAAAGPLVGAVPVIEEGRYGGTGSWAHGGALSGAVLGSSLRAGAGELLPAAALVSVLTSYLSITMVVGLVADGVSMYLRAGVALIAVLVGLCCWLFARTAPEPDLEDADAVSTRPLFATRIEEDADGGLLEMSWDTEETGADRRGRGAPADADEDADEAEEAADAVARAAGDPDGSSAAEDDAEEDRERPADSARSARGSARKGSARSAKRSGRSRRR
ncbi:pyrophosphatase [Brachybacterium hainanense]|uniref:Pyrophosphatase n=1 Tax=Brachybacterium hainanense TaxID=1541174 RepID=A0ABV6RAH4_9MICO